MEVGGGGEQLVEFEHPSEDVQSLGFLVGREDSLISNALHITKTRSGDLSVHPSSKEPSKFESTSTFGKKESFLTISLINTKQSVFGNSSSGSEIST